MQSGHPLRVRQYRVLWTGPHSTTPHFIFSLSVKSCTCWVLWWCLSQRLSQWDGGSLNGQSGSCPFLAYTQLQSHILASGVTCIEGGSGMDGILLDHLKRLMIILDSNVPAIDVCVDLLQTKGN